MSGVSGVSSASGVSSGVSSASAGGSGVSDALRFRLDPLIAIKVPTTMTDLATFRAAGLGSGEPAGCAAMSQRFAKHRNATSSSARGARAAHIALTL